MSREVLLAASTARQAPPCGASVGPTFLCSWTERPPDASGRRLRTGPGAAGSAQPLQGERCELELRACSIVLDMLALALIERADVEGLVATGVRARRALSRIGHTPAVPPVDEPVATPAQLLLAVAERELAR